MHYIPIILSTFLATFAAADFQIYHDHSITGQLDGGINGGDGFMILPGEASCNDVCSHSIWIADVDDASAGRDGIRCKGNGCHGEGPIHELEFHDTESHTHWTIYKNGNFVMRSAKNGSDQGHCRPDRNDRFTDCSCGLGNAENGHRLFICKSSHTARQMNTYK